MAHDFRRPRRANPERLLSLAALDESLARTLATALTTMLRTTVSVKLAGVAEQTYAECVASLDNPSCTCVVRPAPFETRWLVDIGPAIFYPIIDRLLGGGREKSPIARRPPTEIELRLAARIAKVFLDELAAAWRYVADLTSTVERFETNPASAASAAADEAVAATRFDVVIGDAAGPIRLCRPLGGLERIGAKLTSGGWAARGDLEAADLASRHKTAQSTGLLLNWWPIWPKRRSNRPIWPICESATSSPPSNRWIARSRSRWARPRNSWPVRRLQGPQGGLH